MAFAYNGTAITGKGPPKLQSAGISPVTALSGILLKMLPERGA
jgi:hypothetical protein